MCIRDRIQLDTHTPMNTLNLTDGQLDYLQQLVMFAYEMEVPEQKDWDIQTFDNLVDAVCSPTGQPL